MYDLAAMDGGSETLIETPQWSDLRARLINAANGYELLAVGIAFLTAWSTSIDSACGDAGWKVIKECSPDEHPEPSVFVEALLDASTDQSAAEALLVMIVGLDRRLPAVATPGHPLRVDWGPFHELAGGTPFRLIQLPNRQVPTSRQDLTRMAASRHRILPALAGGLAWDIGPLAGDQTATVRNLLNGRLRSDELRFGLWPGLAEVDVAVADECATVGPTDLTRSDALVADVKEGVDWASSHGVGVLVLPELYLPADRLGEIQDHIRVADSAPALTVVGLSHQPAPGGKSLNEAAMLDHRGRMVDHYSKVHGVIVGTEFDMGECLDPGQRVLLRSTPIGWLSVAICLDLFAPLTSAALHAAAPSLLLVPSLSPSTTPHASAASTLAAEGTRTLVANHALGATAAASPSVMAEPGEKPVLAAGPQWWTGHS